MTVKISRRQRRAATTKKQAATANLSGVIRAAAPELIPDIDTSVVPDWDLNGAGGETEAEPSPEAPADDEGNARDELNIYLQMAYVLDATPRKSNHDRLMLALALQAGDRQARMVSEMTTQNYLIDQFALMVHQALGGVVEDAAPVEDTGSSEVDVPQ